MVFKGEGGGGMGLTRRIKEPSENPKRIKGRRDCEGHG